MLHDFTSADTHLQMGFESIEMSKSIILVEITMAMHVLDVLCTTRTLW